MAIPFREIPDNLLVPGQYQEIDNSLAGESGDVKSVLIIATKSAKGSASAGTVTQVMTASAAKSKLGYGSPAAIMAETFLEKNKIEKLFVMPVDEPEAATKMKQSFTVATLSTVTMGAVAISINGKETAAAVADGAKADSIAASIVAAVNGIDNCPVTAAVDDENSAKVNIEAVCKGVSGNDNTVTMTSEVAGVSIEAGEITSATGKPDMEKIIKQLPETRFNYLILEFNDKNSINLMAKELESRYTAMRQIGGRCFVALSGELGDTTTEGTVLYQAESVNCPHIILLPRMKTARQSYVWAAAWCAACCRILADDPAANTYDTEISGITGESIDFNTRQKLLEAGICTYRLDSTGTVLVERLVTSYTENSDGERDTSYLDIQVVETVDAIRTRINSDARKLFKKWKLARTNENFGSGAQVMTPAVFKSFLISEYSDVFIRGLQWCQNLKAYVDSIIVEVKSGSKTRLEYRHRPELIGQFYIGAGLNQFK